MEEVTIPVLSKLDDMWCEYTEQFVRRMSGDERPWFCYFGTRGAHFDNYPHERFLGSSPAKHPYKDTIIELDDIVGRLVAVLEETGQAEDTLIFLSSDNGPAHGELARRRVHAVPVGEGLDLGGRRAGARRSRCGRAWSRPTGPATGCSPSPTCCRRCSRSPARTTRCPTTASSTAVDQSSFLLAPEGRSNRKFVYYWLLRTLSAVRAGEYKFMIASTSDDDTDVAGPGRVHRRQPELHLRQAVQPLPGSQGAAQLPDPEAGLQRGLHQRRSGTTS